MKQFVLGAVATVVAIAVVGAVAIGGGYVDIAADSTHGKFVFELMRWTREHAVAHRAALIQTPLDLANADRIRRGSGNYEAMCESCHLSPVERESEIRKGLYPQPPDLSSPADLERISRTDSERFWIIKHGIKASGMPAWSKAGLTDEDIWNLVAFVKILPGLSADDYTHWAESSEGHSHGGQEPSHSHEGSGHHHEHRSGLHDDAHHESTDSHRVDRSAIRSLVKA